MEEEGLFSPRFAPVGGELSSWKAVGSCSIPLAMQGCPCSELASTNFIFTAEARGVFLQQPHYLTELNLGLAGPLSKLHISPLFPLLWALQLAFAFCNH